MPRTDDQYLVDVARSVPTPIPAFAPDHLHDFDNCTVPGCTYTDAHTCSDLYRLITDKLEQHLAKTAPMTNEQVDITVTFSDDA